MILAFFKTSLFISTYSISSFVIIEPAGISFTATGTLVGFTALSKVILYANQRAITPASTPKIVTVLRFKSNFFIFSITFMFMHPSFVLDYLLNQLILVKNIQLNQYLD